MYAVIKTGGKQHKVTEGDVLSLEKLEGENGTQVIFKEVLMIADNENVKIGRPFVAGATVTGEIVGQKKGPKIHVFKMIRRKGFKKKTGHRQNLTSMKITKISV